jgi:DNA-binding transcriptional ArsR family regulator
MPTPPNAALKGLRAPFHKKKSPVRFCGAAIQSAHSSEGASARNWIVAMSEPAGTMKLSSARNLKVLSVLANPIRVEVLMLLAFSEKCVADIAAVLQLDQSTVSHALRKLLDVGLVEREISKKNHIYKLSEAVEAEIIDGMIRLEVTTDSVRISFQAQTQWTNTP